MFPLEIESEPLFSVDIINIFLEHNVVNTENIEQFLTAAHENIGRVFEKLITKESRQLFKEVGNDKCEW